MPLYAGDKLGPYEILSAIGEGGMGEVYKARDPRLERIVALKVSKEDFTDRFEREARAVAALNHPNICQIYDVGPNYLVMEFIEGTRLEGPMPVEKAIEYGGQILDALINAHSKKVTHRDLKPANILVTKQGIKLLDFGLAKQQAVVEDSDATVKALTVKGQILGTLQYMSPEQLQGKEVDARSDIFAFGCVLYEMLSGRRAFGGENAASLIGAILHKQPEPLQNTPPLDRVIRRCLEKDPDNRFQTARDLKYNLMLPLESAPAAAVPPKRRNWIYAVCAGVAAALAALVWLAARPSTPQEVVSFQINLGDNASWRQGSAISPDGRQITAIASTKDARRQIFLRRLDSLDSHPIPGTTGTNYLAWSPDSKAIAFQADSKLKTVDLSTGVIREIATSAPLRTFDWNAEAFLLATMNDGPLLSMKTSGGESLPATRLDPTKNERSHHSPAFCPDGRHFLYRARHQDGRESLMLGVLGAPEKQTALEASIYSSCVVVPGAGSGRTYLLESRGDSVVARKFDPEDGRLNSESVVVISRARGSQNRRIQPSASRTGVIVYRPDLSGAGKLIWHDRAGRIVEVLPDSAAGYTPALSQDGRLLAVTRTAEAGPEIWMTDLNRKSSMRLILGLDYAVLPAISPDSSRIAFSAIGGIYEASADGSGKALLVAQVPAWPQQYTADGRHLLFVDTSKNELQILPLEGEPKPVTIAPAGPTYFPASLSPDGRFVTYTSTESGHAEVYVRAVPPATGKWLISNNGGGMSAWRGDGRELFYLGADVKMMSVDVQLSPSFRAGAPQPLFQTRVSGVNDNRNNYVASKDGQRFLIVTPPEESQTVTTVILNWHMLLKKGAQAE